jgi:pyruvate/2-oxoglutarate dehydrogenase complex dihydrolipoamide dehydrogenase (E3) component
MLASLGIDVIGAQGEFCRKPTQGFTVNGRFLSARAYLLALGPRPVLPHISGLVTADCGTVESLSSQLAQWEKGRNLVLLGEGMIAVGLAQALSRLGFQIRLLTSELDILSGLDSEVARFLQVQLEMEGVQVINLAEISRVEVRQGKKWLWCQGQEIAVDEMILATQSSLLAETLVESLNLEAVGVKWSAQGIRHNAKLQTTNPRIYVCEGQMNGHWSSHVASYEAAIALKNVLLYPGFKASYQGLPLILNTEPGIAWAGLTEPQAKKQYGEKIWVLQRSFNTLPKAQIRSDLTGFCKLIVHANGKLLGAHLVGHQASEGIGAIALAMQQQIPIQKLADLVLPFPTLTEIIVHTAQDWNHQRLKQNRWLQDLWDVFFDWRRSWGR